MRVGIGKMGFKVSSRQAITKAALLATSTLLLSGRQVHANTINWVASVGDITTNTNWQGNVLPGVNDIADINNAGEAAISGTEGFTAGEIRVGDQGGSGYGILTQTGGTVTDTNWLVVGRSTSGVYNLSGGTLNKTGGGMFIVLGGGSSSQLGLLELSNNASVVGAGSGNFAIGDNDFGLGGSNAQLTLKDQASLDTGGAEFWVGQNAGAVGNVNLSGGTITDSSWMSVGRSGGTGSIDLSGGAINKTGNNSTHFIVGDSNNGSTLGTGVINQSGGALNSSASDFWLGSSGNGTYNITGGTLTTLALDMGMNGGSTGTLNLNGGMVSSTFISHGGGTATINFNGGVLQARSSNTSFLQNFTPAQLDVQAGGAIFDTGGFTNSITVGLQGLGGLTLQGSGGSITLSVSNTYAGDTTINGGTLIIGSAGTLGAGANVNLNGGALGIPSDATISGKTVNFSGGALQLQNYNSSTLSFNNLSNLKLGAATGTASAFAGTITGSSTLTYVGPGTLNLTNSSNTYTGGTFITNGVLQAVPGSLGTGTITVSGTGLLGVSSDASIPGSLVFAGGGISFNSYSSALNFNPGLNLTLGAANGSASTLTGNVTDGPSSQTSLTYVGPGTLNLRGSNIYTGGTNVSLGTLNFTAGSLGASGAILLNGGTLQYATGNTLDITSSPFSLTIASGGGIIDTGSNTVSFAGSITGPESSVAGGFQKSGAGLLNLQGNLITSMLGVRQGTFQLSGSSTVTSTGFTSIGWIPGDTGTMAVTGSSQFTQTGDLNVGDQNTATGTLIVQDNAVVNIRTLYLGKSGTAIGIINQSGGTFQEVNSGAGPGDWRIGGAFSSADASATGTYILSGGNFNTGSANFQPGAYGKGTFIQTGGIVTVGGYFSTGRYPGGVGFYNMSSGNGVVNANTQPSAVVGEQGTGTLAIGGSSIFNAQRLLMAQNDGASSTVNQFGGTINATTGLVIGSSETGNASAPASSVYNFSGGVLAVPSISQMQVSNLTGTAYFNGGTVQATQSGANLISGLTHAYIQTGGLNINASIGSVSITQTFMHDPTTGAPSIDGGLTLVGGQLTMNSSSNTYTGQTNITAGGLLVAGAVNTLSPFSTVNISAGTLDVTGFNNSIAAIIVGTAGTLDMSTSNGAVLTDSGSANFGGTLSVGGSTPMTLPYTLMTYSSFSGGFANTSLPAGTFLSYTPSALILTNGSAAANLVYLNTALQWDTASTPAFNGSSGPTVFHTGDNVTFDDSNSSGPYTVTIGGVVSPGSTTFNNSTGNYVVSAANSSSGIAGSGALIKLGTGSVSLAGNNIYTGGTNVAGGTLTLASATAFPANTALNISTGAKLVVANHGGGSVFTPITSSFSNSGTVDITNNAMVLHNASYGTISAEIASAYHNGAWNGTNSSGGVITSSTAAANPTHLTAVGVATGLTSFPDASVVASDVVVKYTYYGDANLDGVVNSADYTRIDGAWLNNQSSSSKLTGWQNGDFNYDGTVNGSDYTLIDNAFNMQGASLSAQVASPTAEVAGGGVSAVPEPTTLGLSALAALGLLGRRSRRR